MPTTRTKITAVALGAALTLAACGGSGDSGRQRNAALVANTPIQRPVQAIDVFTDNAVTIASDGSVMMIGHAITNQHEITDATKGKKIVAVGTGASHAGALDADGVLYARGWDWESTLPRLPANATKWVDFDFDARGIIAIADTGVIVHSARSSVTGYRALNLNAGATKFVRVEAGWSHYVALDDLGNAYATGLNREGQLNIPQLRNGGTRFVDISAKFYSTGLVDDAGNVYVVGWTPGTLAPPALRDGGTKFIDIEVGTRHYSLLDDVGNVYHVSNDRSMPVSSRPSEGSRGFSAMAAGTGFTLTLDDKGELAVSRSAKDGYPVLHQRTLSIPIAASGDTTFVQGDDGMLYQIGEKIVDVLPSALGVVGIGAGPTNFLTVNAAGIATASGDNSFGQSTPPDRNDIVRVVGGSSFSVGVTATGQLVRWGVFPAGTRDSMHTSSARNSVIDIVAGVDHITVLTARGEPVSFGWLDTLAPNYLNAYVDAEEELIPLQKIRETYLLSEARFSAVAAHGRCSAAVSKQVRRARPVIVWGECAAAISAGTDLGDVRQLVIGAAHGAALRSNGTVVAWGDNSLGQTNVPSGLKDVVHLAAGDNHTVAVDREGRVWAWGDNSQGQTVIPENLRLSTRDFASLVESRNLAAQQVTNPEAATTPKDIASLLGPALPADAPAGTADALIQVPAPAPNKPVTTGLNVKRSQRITPARGLRLLRIKGATKPSFVVTKRRASSPCTVTKTRLTATKSGVCSATISYTTAKGKKATARLVIVITS